METISTRIISHRMLRCHITLTFRVSVKEVLERNSGALLSHGSSSLQINHPLHSAANAKAKFNDK